MATTTPNVNITISSAGAGKAIEAIGQALDGLSLAEGMKHLLEMCNQPVPGVSPVQYQLARLLKDSDSYAAFMAGYNARGRALKRKRPSAKAQMMWRMYCQRMAEAHVKLSQCGVRNEDDGE